MTRNQRYETRIRNRKAAADVTPDSALPIAVCASTFRNIYGREATSAELSSMTGIPATTIIGLYMPTVFSGTPEYSTAAAV